MARLSAVSMYMMKRDTLTRYTFDRRKKKERQVSIRMCPSPEVPTGRLHRIKTDEALVVVVLP
jgi:hypothetical protein